MRLRKRQRWNDLQPLAKLRDQIDRMFEDPAIGATEFFGSWSPAVDVLEDKDKLTVKAELPGFRREDIEVALHGNNLVLSGERKQENEHKEGEFYRAERFYGKFRRSIQLPYGVDIGKIQANYRDGVLTVMLPKSENTSGHRIDVKSE
jgi:HSP20 family protein